jgi:hypothetical protein
MWRDSQGPRHIHLHVLDLDLLTIWYYTKHDIYHHQFLLSFSILIVNHGVMSPTLNVNPTLFVIRVIFFGRLYIYTYEITIIYQTIFHPILSHPRQHVITSCWQEEVRFWPMDELLLHTSMTIFVHSFIRSVIQKLIIVTSNTICHQIEERRNADQEINMIEMPIRPTLGIIRHNNSDVGLLTPLEVGTATKYRILVYLITGFVS